MRPSTRANRYTRAEPRVRTPRQDRRRRSALPWERRWPSAPERVRGVLLDVDGTLVDSNDAHARAWHLALTEAGFDVTWPRVRRLMGMGGDKLVPLATGLTESDGLAVRIAERRAEIFRTGELPSIEPFAGTRDLLLAMRREGIAFTVVSSAEPRELQALLERAGVGDLVSPPPASTGDVPSKPDSSLVHAGLNRLGFSPREVVMLGDTPYDLEASRKADVACIIFRSGGWHDVQLSGAIAVYDGPWDLLAQLDTSPLKPQGNPRAIDRNAPERALLESNPTRPAGE